MNRCVIEWVGGSLLAGGQILCLINVTEEDDALVFELVKNEEDEVVFDVPISRVVPEISPLTNLA